MIGIIGAMAVEVDALKEKLEAVTTKKISGVEFVSGRLYDKDIVVACCGIGKVFAAIAAEAMILKYNPDVILNTGVAGALSDKFDIADIAIATDVVQHDMNTTPLGDPPGLLSGINIVNIPCSEYATSVLTEAVSTLKITNYRGTIASGDLFVNTIKQKRTIAEKFNAIACEMEGASIGHVCYVNGVDFAVLRSVSDTLKDDSGMEYTEFVKIAAKNSIAVTNEFIKQY